MYKLVANDSYIPCANYSSGTMWWSHAQAIQHTFLRACLLVRNLTHIQPSSVRAASAAEWRQFFVTSVESVYSYTWESVPIRTFYFQVFLFWSSQGRTEDGGALDPAPVHVEAVRTNAVSPALTGRFWTTVANPSHAYSLHYWKVCPLWSTTREVQRGQLYVCSQHRGKRRLECSAARQRDT